MRRIRYDEQVSVEHVLSDLGQVRGRSGRAVGPRDGERRGGRGPRTDGVARPVVSELTEGAVVEGASAADGSVVNPKA